MCYSKLKWRKFNPSENFLNQVKDLTTISKLASFLIANFKYQWDEPGFWGDHWKTPEETLNDSGGDCDDFAIFNNYVVNKIIKKESYMITYTGYFVDKDGIEQRNGHAVCVYKNGDDWKVLSNNILMNYSEKTFEDIGRRFYPAGLLYMEVINNEGKTLQVKLPKYFLWGRW